VVYNTIMKTEQNLAEYRKKKDLEKNLERAWIACGAEPAEGPSGGRDTDSPGVQLEWLEGILISPRPDIGLEVLRLNGALDVMLPELTALVELSGGEARHKDLWEHTVKVVMQSECTPVIRWAALLHDIGKARTRRIDERGRVHFFGHAEVGAGMCERILKRMKMDSAARRKIKFLVLFHHRASQYDLDWTDSAVRRFGREVGSALNELIALSRADMTTRRAEKKNRGLRHLDHLCERLAAIKEADKRVAPLPKGLGTAIIERFGIKPGPRIGRLRDFLEQKVEEGELEPLMDAEYYMEYLRSSGIIEKEDL